jgi:hypothetical protein
MTRFKELDRIERAIRDGDTVEPEWVRSYSRSRVAISPNNAQRKHWSELSAKSRGRDFLTKRR